MTEHDVEAHHRILSEINTRGISSSRLTMSSISGKQSVSCHAWPHQKLLIYGDWRNRGVMIRERPSLASIIAGQTCDRQHVSARACSRSTSLLRVILMLYCITMISGQKFANRRSSVKELQKVLNSQRVNKYCNFEENCTTWFFENFIRVMASSAPSLPTTDADNSTEGNGKTSFFLCEVFHVYLIGI